MHIGGLTETEYSPEYFRRELEKACKNGTSPEILAGIYAEQTDYYLGQAANQVVSGIVNAIDFEKPLNLPTPRFQIVNPRSSGVPSGRKAIPLSLDEVQVRQLRELAVEDHGNWFVKPPGILNSMVGEQKDPREVFLKRQAVVKGVRDKALSGTGDYPLLNNILSLLSVLEMHLAGGVKPKFPMNFSALHQLIHYDPFSALDKVNGFCTEGVNGLFPGSEGIHAKAVLAKRVQTLRNDLRTTMIADIAYPLLERREKEISALVQPGSPYPPEVMTSLKEAAIAAHNAVDNMKTSKRQLGNAIGG